MKYHLFAVNDYKGGELVSTINLNLEEALEFYYSEEPVSSYSNKYLIGSIEDLYNKFIADFESNISIYAGNSGRTTPEVYIIKKGELVHYEFTKDQIINWLSKEVIKELKYREENG